MEEKRMEERKKKLCGFFKYSDKSEPQSLNEKLKATKTELNSHFLSKSVKQTISITISKAETAMDHGMTSTAETLLAKANREIQKAVTQKRNRK
jgi:hypothetical protein